MPTWLLYALVSALFAALTAIFAKAGLKEVNSDLATAIRTGIILFITWGIVFFKGNAGGINNLSKNNWLLLRILCLIVVPYNKIARISQWQLLIK